LADIRPFHGTHYNPSLVKDLAKVICPPYDVISPQMQQELYRRSESNFIRIEFGREFPQDKTNHNRYTRAAATLENWLAQGILKTDARPCVYISDHHFMYLGREYRRRSLVCLVRLEEWDRMIVRPHEGTLSSAKGDRLNLLWALRANTSPVMSLYEDPNGRISSLIKKSCEGKSLLSADSGNGESQRIWAIDDAGTIAGIRECLAGQPLYIADGHHRYESALAYRRERRPGSSTEKAEESYDFVMMSLIDITDPGLVILPAHRLVRGLAPAAIDGLMNGLKTYFSVGEQTLNQANVLSQIGDLLSENEDEVRLVIYGLNRDRLYQLRLLDFTPVRPMMPYFHSELYQKLDVSIVDHVILEKILGLAHGTATEYLDYTNNVMEAINRVLDQEYQLAFLVNPVKPGIIKTIADSGDRMPHKSTYFFPKIPAGLVFYRFT
jgi:uncharacterized protein (DUF1015 family)